MIDIVCVFCNRDLEATMLQARSIATYFKQVDIGRIIYICNGPVDKSWHWVGDELSRRLGGIDVLLLRNDDLGVTTEDPKKGGWTTQQVLKLEVSRFVRTRYYIVLDAKNHFVQPVGLGQFIAPNGKVAATVKSLRGPNLDGLRFGLEYFSVPSANWQGTGLRGCTPFVFETGVVRDLIECLETKERASVVHTFFKHYGTMTEFLIYQAFLLYKGWDLLQVYEPGKQINLTIWLPQALDPVAFEESVTKAESGAVDMLSIHWLTAHVLSSAQRGRLCSLWLGRGLIDSICEGERVIEWQIDNTPDKDKPFLREQLDLHARTRP
jgi:hypothetical protein